MSLSMSTSGYLTVTAQLADRPDGGVRVSSRDLPGLILSGSDKEQVIKDIAVAIKALLESSGVHNVRVHHSKTVAEIMNGKNPQDVDMNVEHFVVEYADAA